MNYIWDVIIKAKQLGVNENNVRFIPAKRYSPYMELSTIDINMKNIERDIEVNSDYRFHEIFKEIVDINYYDDMELRTQLFDILLHFLTDIDIYQGMNKKEYYIIFILREIEKGLFGENLKKSINLFTREEKDIIICNILKLYTTGEELYLLRDTLLQVFKRSIIYIYSEEKDEIFYFVNRKKNEIDEAKLEFINEMFLPIRFHMEVYWENHFGMIGVDETMVVNRIELC